MPQSQPEIQIWQYIHACSSTTMSSKLKYIQGDLFSAPHNAILVHACNTRGSWGAGIALAFKNQYPAQYETYQTHCKLYGPSLIGSCLLLPGTSGAHSIACLFTSRAYGKHKDSPQDILIATRAALGDLLDQNKDGKPLHAWCILTKYAVLEITLNLSSLQPLQLWQVCCALGRYGGNIAGA